eukprot:NODE_20_length_44879_cov_0.624654.p34 type:complete len:111 gc:universal NODE_20_length_44879_cov_0.624654:27713-28045(+)
MIANIFNWLFNLHFSARQADKIKYHYQIIETLSNDLIRVQGFTRVSFDKFKRQFDFTHRNDIYSQKLIGIKYQNMILNNGMMLNWTVQCFCYLYKIHNVNNKYGIICVCH